MSDLSDSPKGKDPELAEGEVLQEEDKDVTSRDDARDGRKNLIMRAEVSEWSWYLPRPEVFGKYSEDVQRKIMHLVEQESKHRHGMEEKALTANINRDSRGQRYVLFIVIGVVLMTAILIGSEKPNGIYVLFGIAPAFLPIVDAIIQMIQKLFRQNKSGQKEDKSE